MATEKVIEMDVIEASVIDVMIRRFPHVVTNVFKELDDKTLNTCRSVSRLCCDHIDSEKFLWFQRYRKNMGISYPHWNKVLKNTPVGLVKEFSVATQQFFKDDEDWKRKFQWSPLQIVAEQGDFELFMFISEKTKKTKPIINYGNDVTHPIYMAAKKGREEICKVLIVNSVLKNPYNINNGMTALHFAAERGLNDVCELIIESIDSKNPRAVDKCTPLHLAAKGGHLEIVRLIVETGVNKHRKWNGKTPFDLAGSFRSYDFYRLLCKDKTQLRDRILSDLRVCFSIYLLVFLLLFYLISISSRIAYWALGGNGDDFIDVMVIIVLGTFVSYVVVSLLTIMTTLRPIE